MLKIRTILHPTDLSESSDAAFPAACALARDYQARLLIVHVVEPPPTLSGEGLLVVPPAEEEAEVRQRLRRLQPPDSRIHVRHLILRGDPAGEILRVANRGKCDAIVMSTHGRTGLSRLVMGSVAEEVVRHAPCPVMTVRTPVALVEDEDAAEKIVREAELSRG